MSKKFKIAGKEPPRETLFVRLHPHTIKRLKELAKETGINRAEIIQQALDYALERLEL